MIWRPGISNSVRFPFRQPLLRLLAVRGRRGSGVWLRYVESKVGRAAEGYEPGGEAERRTDTRSTPARQQVQRGEVSQRCGRKANKDAENQPDIRPGPRQMTEVEHGSEHG